MGSLTRVGSMSIGYYSSPSEHVFLWFCEIEIAFLSPVCVLEDL